MAQQRKLAAILFTDIVGYTAMMQQNEEYAVRIVRRYITVLKETVASYSGEVLNDYGDGSLCIFSSATEAMQCAIEIQRQLQAEPIVPLRIGLHIGEIFFEDGKILGDGVNVASRIQSLGDANTILFSGEILNKIRNRPEFKTVSLGYFDFKNVDAPMEIFALANEGLIIPARKKMEGKLKKRRAVTKNIFIGAALLILIIGFLVFKIYFQEADLPVNEKSIAVLPFVDMSSNKDQEYFGDGIAEEIINSLTTIKDLKIIGRTSSFQFKGEKIDLREVGKKLQAGIILEGSVQKHGNRIRITAQLIRVKDNSHLWSEKYDKELADIFKIQDDIAANIVAKLKFSLTNLQRQRLVENETDPEVYNLYLKGLYAYRESKYEQSIQYNLGAIKKDSEYAPSYASIALAKAWMIIRNRDFKNSQALAEAQSYAQNAIRINPQLAEGYSAIALMARAIEHNFSKAREFFDKSLELNPASSLTKNRYGYFLFSMGDFEKASKLALEALQSDPVDYNSYIVLANVYIYTGKLAEADKYIREGQKLFPDRHDFQILLFTKRFMEDKYSDLITEYESLKAHNEKIDNSSLPFLCIAYQRLGRKKESDDIFLYLKNLSVKDKSRGNYFTAMVFAARNEKDSCFARLQIFLDQFEFSLTNFKIEPLFEPLKGDARYKKLYTQYGFDRY